ncbi:glucuronoxylan 4-O-methyltransferase 3-like [Lycium barbarum]|uniref:glucuronoxylan 4-O-methyltransferase 3-like n=1 Tax=Lycium barbarum TaxID=112863 RepID=UPI00293E8BF7|nr:glucuronoxylan 4-O-methyltransferase 3-like [Lycium barbarum]
MKENQMTSKNQHTMVNKLILSCIFFIFLLYLILRANSPSFKLKNISISSSTHSTCNKIPPSLAKSLLHYATTNRTPQQQMDEISVTYRVLEKKSPCNLLVFGLGFDSLMWRSFNHNGRTVFIEENQHWIDKITKEVPSLEAYHQTYDTRLDQASELLSIGKREDSCKFVGDPRNSKCPLALTNLPKEVYENEWDLIMIDAPTGAGYDLPGRMKVIYTAGLLARNRENGETDVFVHDCKRYAEDKFSRNFLCEGYIREEVRYLRHFTIPSYRSGSIKSFCP